MRRLGRRKAARSRSSRHGDAQNGGKSSLGSEILRDTRTQFGDIHASRKPQNDQTGVEPRQMRLEITDLAAANRHRLEQTIAKQKTAIGDGHMRVLRRDDPAILPDAHH